MLFNKNDPSGRFSRNIECSKLKSLFDWPYRGKDKGLRKTPLKV